MKINKRTFHVSLAPDPGESSIDWDKRDWELAERQRRHLANLIPGSVAWHPSQCSHNNCSKCHGTGRTSNGPCVHSISCPCSRCSPRC